MPHDPEGNETLMYDASVTWAYTYDNENHMTSAAMETSTDAGPGWNCRSSTKYPDAFGNMTQEMETCWSGGTGTTRPWAWEDVCHRRMEKGRDKVGSTGSSGTGR